MKKKRKGYLERILIGVFVFDAVTPERRREAETGVECEGMDTLWWFIDISMKFGV